MYKFLTLYLYIFDNELEHLQDILKTCQLLLP